MMTKDAPTSMFDPDDVGRLAQIAEMMIPSSAESPGSSDPAILNRILSHLARSYSQVQNALAALEAKSIERFGAGFCTLSESQQRELCPDHLDPQFRAQFELFAASSYFSDERVMKELGMPPRPPFPLGYELPETDWALLDPVKERGSISRPVD